MSIAATLAKLQEAQGDPRKLALATLDIVLASQEPWLSEAMEAAAIPHWFTPAILAKLLSIDETTAAQRVERLQQLPMVEHFAARDAWNVHEATRLALRLRLATENPNRFRQVSELAAQCFPGKEPFQRLETVFHSVVAAPEAAEKELFGLWNSWHGAGRHEPLQALGISLQELSEVPLEPSSRAWVLLCLALTSKDRLPGAQVEIWARQSLELFQRLGSSKGEIECRALLGDVLLKRGQREEALREFKAFRQLTQKLTAEDPENENWQREVSVSHNRVGGVLEAEGRREEALREYEAAKQIMLQLTRQDPENADWQRELSASHIKVGGILAAAGRRVEALHEYEAGKQIMLQLTRQDPGNARWQRELSVSNNNVGDVLTAEGRPEEALREYDAGKEIMLQLTRQDPEHADWQRELSASHTKVGGILEADGRREEALGEYEAGKQIILRVTRQDPGNAGWQRDLSVSYNNVGGILEAEGRREEALREYEAGKRILLQLTRQDPENADWQRELSASYNRIGAILALNPDSLDRALAEHQASLEIAKRLVKIDPHHQEWKADLEVFSSWVESLQKSMKPD
jgi:tetratricopeptide (TPR) repeat protein